MASSSSTPSSANTLTKKYHVFLSFRGEDTRFGFTSHLYAALSGKCMVTFIDYKLVRGDEISPALLKSIHESKIAVVIFSKEYASSKWCLRELAEMMKCKKSHELIVLPVFYNVDPSDVRNQTGPFKDSFALHKNESPEEVQEWRKALTEASNRAGWPYDGKRSEVELIRDIVKDVQGKLTSETENISEQSDFEGLIGIHKRIERVMSLLCLDTMDVRIIGIWGMGGIGKTTLAEAVFNRISGTFDSVCFKRNVRETIEKYRSLDSLIHEVLSEVLVEKKLKLDTHTILQPFIKDRLKRKKVLIVLDDVSTSSQLETLVKVLKQCDLGSRMITTFRDKKVLDNFVDNHDLIYDVDGLEHGEAFELFCENAFKKKQPTEGFTDLSEWMVSYAKGHPLTLKVLGSALWERSKQEWESVVDDLLEIGDSEIFNVLKISYDRLNDQEQILFLDIACFFFGRDHEDIAKLMLDWKFYLRALSNKSLITIKEGEISMHDLLQEMGRKIVSRESNNPGKRSRLWKPDDVIWTLKNNKGTGAVQGISLDMDDLQDDLILGFQVFDNMYNLRLLLFTSNSGYNTVCLPDNLNSLPNNLIILNWPHYPSRALPSDFSPKKLVKLDISGSNIEQLWGGTKDAPKLKWLCLYKCPCLTRIPNLSNSLSLEEVDLRDCESLVEFPLTLASIKRLRLRGTAIEEVPSSIQSLTNLVELDLSRCTRLKHISAGCFKLNSLTTLRLDDCSELETLREFSETMEILNSQELSGMAITVNGLQRLTLSKCKNLEMLPSSICDLTSLEYLNLSNCSKLDKLPENLGNLKSLKGHTVEGSAVRQLPSSITCLENLGSLDCSKCRGLTILPPLSGLHSLSILDLKECNLMEIPEDIGCLSTLKRLDLRGNMFESLPKSIKHLSKLETLSLSDCNMLRSLTELPVALKKLEAINCKQLCQALPDASEFKRCITSKYHISRWECDEHAEVLCRLCQYVQFFFFNCFNLDQKAVSNVFKESLEGSEEPPTQFSIYLPGTEIPEWFTYESSGSSINIRVLRQDLFNRKFMGFAICAVLGIEEFHELPDCLAVDIYFHFETCADRSDFPPSGDFSTGRVSINSDHILLGYSSFSKFYSSSQNLKMLPGSECDHMDIRFKFDNPSEEFKVKYCAVHPIHAKPMKIIGATIEDIGETSGRRSGRSDDNEEEVEPHSKRFCTQP